MSVLSIRGHQFPDAELPSERHAMFEDIDGLTLDELDSLKEEVQSRHDAASDAIDSMTQKLQLEKLDALQGIDTVDIHRVKILKATIEIKAAALRKINRYRDAIDRRRGKLASSQRTKLENFFVAAARDILDRETMNEIWETAHNMLEVAGATER